MNLSKYMKGKTQGMLQALILKDDKKGVTQGTVSNWLNFGVPRIRREQLQRISKKDKKPMTVAALEREWNRKQKEKAW